MNRPIAVEGSPCPFWKAATTDQRKVDPKAPAPLDPKGPNSIAAAAEQLKYHAGFSSVQAAAVAELLVVAANEGTLGKIHGLFTQSFVPTHLSGGLLDKELDTRMLRFVDPKGIERVGKFSEADWERMFSKANASDYVIDGEPRRAMNADQLLAFVEANRDTVGAGRVHHFMAKFEMRNLLLEHFGRNADDGTRVITAKDARVFYDLGIFPHARLDQKIAKTYPAEVGAALALDPADGSVERMVTQGTANACPFMGVKPDPKEGTPNPAFESPPQTDADRTRT